MKVNPSIFRLYDIRGIAGEKFTEKAVDEYEKWYGKFYFFHMIHNNYFNFQLIISPSFRTYAETPTDASTVFIKYIKLT